MDLTVAGVAVAVVIIIFGSVVQGTIGFGLGLLAAPFIAIVIPDAIPVTLVLVAWPIGGVTALREHHALDRKALPWMLAGAVPGTKHVVAKGETLTSIAKQYNISLNDLKNANRIGDERKLQIGQILSVPAPKAPETSDKKENP